ncbi:hypothetical protein ACH4SP_04140 [Streptomyces sp. NPDC021093]|uniref:hypothetical protein n=1 Tax=Streptomyces sp. NPDC021093 TaxID=3365112 RepID=UPI003793452D
MITPTARHMVEVSGTETLWLLESAAQGRLVHIQREQPDEIKSTGGTGWTVPATGPAEVVTVTGFRPAHAETLR